MYIGASSAKISQAFFLPSQVVSPTNKSAILKNGQVLSNLAPSDAFIKGQVAVGNFFSPPGTQNCDPEQSPVEIPFAAQTTSSGTWIQKLPITFCPFFELQSTLMV